MSVPGLFFGAESSAAVLAAGVGEADNGTPFACRALSRNAAPAGPHGQCIFTAATVTLNHRRTPENAEAFTSTDVVVKAYVDGREVSSTTFVVLQVENDAVNPPPRTHLQYRVPFSVPFMLDGIEVMRQPPRGSLFQMEVEWPGGGVGVDAAAIHYSVVRDGRAPV